MRFHILFTFLVFIYLIQNNYNEGIRLKGNVITYLKFINILPFQNNKKRLNLSNSAFDKWGIKDLLDKKPFSLIRLPFNPKNMSPFLSEDAIFYHYTKHHATYVKNMNNFAEEIDELKNLSLEDIIKKYDGKIFNNAAQVWNHNFFWKGLTSDDNNDPHGDIGLKINESFGSYDNFKKLFLMIATSHFGSGWVWLIYKDGDLKIIDTHDGYNPIKNNLGFPIIVLDIWEHSYYVDYKHDRAKYINEWFNKINWEFANINLNIATN